MATVRSIGKIPSIKQHTLYVDRKIKLDALQDLLRRRFEALGCPTCLSGLNRLVIEDRVLRTIR